MFLLTSGELLDVITDKCKRASERILFTRFLLYLLFILVDFSSFVFVIVVVYRRNPRNICKLFQLIHRKERDKVG